MDSDRRAVRVSGYLVAVVLIAVGLLQVSWGLGSTWPAPDRHSLLEAIGLPVLPPTWMTVGLAVVIAAGGLVVLGRLGVWGRRLPPWIFAAGAWGVTLALALGSLLNITARGPWERFFFGPLALVLAILAALVASSHRTHE